MYTVHTTFKEKNWQNSSWIRIFFFSSVDKYTHLVYYYTYQYIINVNDRRLLFILINISLMLFFEAKYKFDLKRVFRIILIKIFIT